jgi:hypothetical protein
VKARTGSAEVKPEQKLTGCSPTRVRDCYSDSPAEQERRTGGLAAMRPFQSLPKLFRAVSVAEILCGELKERGGRLSVTPKFAASREMAGSQPSSSASCSCGPSEYLAKVREASPLTAKQSDWSGALTKCQVGEVFIVDKRAS